MLILSAWKNYNFSPLHRRKEMVFTPCDRLWKKVASKNGSKIWFKENERFLWKKNWFVVCKLVNEARKISLAVFRQQLLRLA